MPTERNYDKQLEYDFANQKIIINSNITSNCENYCFIIIGVFSKFKFGGYESLFTSEYSILFRNKIKSNNQTNLEQTVIYNKTYILEFSYNGFEIEYKISIVILHYSIIKK